MPVSAREPFARVVEDNPESVEPDSVYIGTVRISSHGCPTIAQKHAAAINAAHADRVAAELEAAADDVERYAPDAMEMLGHHDGTLSNATRERIATWLYVRAKAIREGGGK